jgi:hypothetical protein
MAKSIHPVLTANEAWAEVDQDQTRAFVVVRPEEAHLFGYPGFIAMRLPHLDDGIFFRHPGRSCELRDRLANAPPRRE